MKKLLILLLALIIVFAFCSFALASNEEYALSILANDSGVISAQKDSTITVTLHVSKQGVSSFDLFAMQDYVCFDTEYFELVDGSIKAAAGFSASPVTFNEQDGAHNMVFINRASINPQNVTSGECLLSFELKVLKNGQTSLTHDTVEVLDEFGAELSTKTINAEITIKENSDEPSEPDIPSVPDTPSNPSTPSVPDTPSNPSTPSVPDIPSIPSIPSNPTTPSVPSIPSNPSTPSVPSVPGKPDISVIPEIPYIPAEESFADTEGHWAESAINTAVGYGLFKGVEENSFAPDTAMSRGMVVTVLSRIAQVNTAEYAEAAFTDIPDGAYYAAATNWAAAMKITSGIGNGLFGPNDELTREQFAAMVYNFLAAYGYVDVNEEVSATDFADSDKISSWARPAVEYCAANGILVGYPNGSFGAKDIVDRAQAAAIMVRIVEKYINK